MTSCNWESLYTKHSDFQQKETLGELFDTLFGSYEKEFLEQLKNEISFFVSQDENRQKVKEYQRDKFTKDHLKKIVKRDVKKLRAVEENPTPKHIAKAEEIFFKHYGKYDVFEITEVINYLLDIKAHKTLVFNTANKYHKYPKTSVVKMSLESQMKSVLQKHDIDATQHIKTFLREL